MVTLCLPEVFQRQQVASDNCCLRKKGDTDGKNSTILLMFYQPPPDDPFMNRAVAWLDGPFSHVEIGFSDGMASSIYSGETVFMHPRSFANPNYTTVAIQVSPEQLKKARKMCVDSAARGVQFDSIGMYMVGMPILCKHVVAMTKTTVNKGGMETTFCSKYVSNILKEIGVEGFTMTDIDSTSPSMVHRILMKNCNRQVVATTPYKLEQLSRTGVFFRDSVT